jgi:flagellar basal body-associated protein FliL
MKINNEGKVDLVIVLVIILANALLGFVLYFFFIRGSETPQQHGLTPLTRTEVDHHKEDYYDDKPGRYNDNSSDFGAKDYAKDYAIWELGDMIVNPYGGDTKFFITSISFEYRLSDKKLPAELQSKLPLFKDSIQNYFARITVEDLRDIELRDGFKRDIMRSVNGMLIEGRITNVIFSQWLFQ